MRRLKLKCTEGTQGKLLLQHPLAKPGFDGRVQTFEITNIPDNIQDSEVIRLANLTVFYFPNKAGRWSFDFSELGEGIIIRG